MAKDSKFYYNLNELNQLVFNSYRRGEDENSLIKTFYSRKHVFHMPEAFSVKYIRFLFKKFHKEGKLRKQAYKKLDDFQSVVLYRFIQNNSPMAFLPQIKISKVLGVSQKTVSRKLKKLLDDGIIRVVKKYKHYERMAHEYVLTWKGQQLVLKMLKGLKKSMYVWACERIVSIFDFYFLDDLKEPIKKVIIKPPEEVSSRVDIYANFPHLRPLDYEFS